MQTSTTTTDFWTDWSEIGEIEAWRIEQLTTAGWDPMLADLIAHSRGIDLHHACELARGGCNSGLALSILF